VDSGTCRHSSNEVAPRDLAGTMRCAFQVWEASMVALFRGNQQKSVVGRWLAKRPLVYIMDEPTKGIDVGAQGDIHRLMGRLAAEGMGILLISSRLPSCWPSRIGCFVMHKGQIAGIAAQRIRSCCGAAFASTGDGMIR